MFEELHRSTPHACPIVFTFSLGLPLRVARVVPPSQRMISGAAQRMGYSILFNFFSTTEVGEQSAFANLHKEERAS